MIWQNYWAWLGLSTLAVPLLLHLLSRRRARVQPFPTLRFLPASRLTISRRARPTDVLLLALRMGILTAAVAALAQPYFTGIDSPAMQSSVTRVVVVDTSASMQRQTSTSGERALDSARRAAAAAGASSPAAAGSPGTVGMIIETADPATAVAGAVAWLVSRPGAGELVVISDFQRGSLDPLDLAAVPRHIGLELQRMPAAGVATADLPVQYDGRALVTRVVVQPASTEVEWFLRAGADTLVPSSARSNGLILLHAGGERAAADAALAAAAAIGSPATAVSRPVTIVLAGHEQLSPMMSSAMPLNAAWMGDIVAALHRDRLLTDLAAQVPTGTIPGAEAAPFATVVRTRSDAPLVSAARLAGEDGDRLLLLVRADASSVAAAAVAAAVARASSDVRVLRELEIATLPDTVLARWQRSAMPAPASRAAIPPDASHGRWLWLVVLVLLGVEALARRGKRTAAAAP
ncbi:MAG: BatA domain-containing protein [Gemmatimonadota bacterium]